MNDRHTKPRIYTSGAQKRNLKVERNKQIEEVISQIPKLTNYFSSSRQLANVSNNEITDEHFEILTSKKNETMYENEVIQQSSPTVENNSSTEKKNDDSEHLDLNTKNTIIIENEYIIEPEISNSFISFKNDVGIWPQNSTNEMIKYWIKQGFTNLQNCDEKL